ncbi:bifunctional 23S rRNA (guanine(2069)-N(7))-methyltransferase RlmK/23S rRNA (guanine(2445)-N(2))-methyltransferase RlmL [Novipirellula artificiosorum]|uniref:Ribosomal RNA large subunit methyltransferase K n=1 Tax=Novipirellula artificiosorum TaxID=2528016 RepID=A0A5C6E0B3_9BACT|nr:bifunctional 23S rRNA (guanine(2069)-N(7))-methyltransferase RlmK/23S rRNA (guanine(2445)-N(2))-methyltransferase RlmL [Novipirellula artificiosorum]TWU42300.1 Ribosomal RNA large subunit methyltransferase K [Novipirellula artificiosorum]
MSSNLNDESYDLIAACAFGLEAIVRRELESLGIDASIGEAGRVHFRGGRAAILEANLWLRTADRILIRIAEFPAADFDALFDTTRAIEWGKWIAVDASFPVTGRSVKSALTSVPACQRTVKRAIVDALRRDHATETLPETGCEYKVDIALLKDVATITIDTTGRSLHRRGYRTHVSKAPLKETLAAAMVLLSYWKAGRPMIDPFCGSGTIPIEAARIGRNIAPGLTREFACEAWQDYPAELWQDARATAQAAILPPLEERIIGSDLDGRVLRAARENAERAAVADDIHFHAQPLSELTSKRRFGCLITNPPYGLRIGNESYREQRELDALYESIPHVLRKLPTWSHYLLTAYPRFERVVGRSADRRRKLYNGRIECTYYQFHGPKPVINPLATNQPAIDEPVNDEPVNDEPVNDEPVNDEPVNDAPVNDELVAGELEADANGLREAREPETGLETGAPTKPSTADGVKPKPYVHASGTPAFGHLSDKGLEQAELFATRLRKRAKHLRRWPTRRGITCFRLYERDIPEIPLIVDRYEDYLHLTEYERPHDRDPAQHANWLDLMAETAGKTLEVPKQNVFFKRRGRQRGKTQHEKVDETNQKIEVHEGGLKFLVNLADYVDTGLFLDHRITRQMVRELADGKHFLNLFAYTGSFSVYAAAGGAKSTLSVDLSKSYLDWGWQNMRLNGFLGNQHRFVAEDVKTFLRNHPPGEKYDLVVFDPPTFSNSKRTEEDWDVQTDSLPLLNELMPLVRKGGVIYFSTNFRRFKFDVESVSASEVHEISNQTVPEDFRNRRIHRCWRIVR